jgi:hypothetical protein
MWNNYTVEMQNRGRIEDHLAEARADALEAEARAADPHVSRVALATRRATVAAARLAAETDRRARARVDAARSAVVGRARAARHRVALVARRLRHVHPHRPTWIHHRA